MFSFSHMVKRGHPGFGCALLCPYFLFEIVVYVTSEPLLIQMDSGVLVFYVHVFIGCQLRMLMARYS